MESQLWRRRAPLCATALSLILSSSTAHADPAPSDEFATVRLPVAQAERPITLPRLVLGTEIGFDGVRQLAHGIYDNLTASVAFGITDDLALRAVLAPLQLAGPPGTGFYYGQSTEDHGPSAGAVYRLVRGVVEVGAGLDVRLLTAQNLSGVAILPQVPIRIHASRDLRFDVTPTLNVWRARQTGPGTEQAGSFNTAVPPPQTDDANAVRFNLPVSALYNITTPLDIGITSGLTVYDLSNVRGTTGIPLGAFVGYAIASAPGPVLDIEPHFAFPYLIMPWARSTTNTSQYVVGVNLTGYLYL